MKLKDKSDVELKAELPGLKKEIAKLDADIHFKQVRVRLLKERLQEIEEIMKKKNVKIIPEQSISI